MNNCDFLIIGGGVVGLSIANSLKAKNPRAKIIILEKERDLGFHSSGRNSGVVHAGFYYTANSLKAKFTREGNRRLHAFCEERKLPINKCGKLVVTRNESEEATLDELFRRGQKNDVPLEIISAKAAEVIDPRAKTFKRAIWSPTTASVNPKQVLSALARDLIKEGVDIIFDTAYVGYRNKTVQTTREKYQAGYIVNAAGLYADRVARDFGFSQDYRILPFKGLYVYSKESAGAFKTNIYPVPNLNNPFLGVHFTLTVDGKVKVGPTAIPAFWREQYDFTSNFSFSEFCEIIFREFGLLFSANFDFKGLALEEIKKYSKKHLIKLAAELVKEIDPAFYQEWGKPGIRAQLYNIKTKKLEMDFIFEGDKESFHVLNAVSPAFTASMPFADYLVEKMTEI